MAPGSGGPVTDVAIYHDGERYVVRAVDDHLKIARDAYDGPVWLDASVPITELGGEARRALATGDMTCPALLVGLRFIVSAALTPASTHNQRRKGQSR